MLIFLLSLLASCEIPLKYKSLVHKARKNALKRSLLSSEEKQKMLFPGVYRFKGAKIRVASPVLGETAKEIKGSAYEDSCLAIIKKPKANLTDEKLIQQKTAFVIDQKMYRLNELDCHDDEISIYKVSEINYDRVITEIELWTQSDNPTGKRKTLDTLSVSASLNWDDDADKPQMIPLAVLFPNLKFGVGAKGTASVSARVYSRGANYMFFTCEFKLTGMFAAGLEAESGSSNPDDIDLVEIEKSVSGVDISIFGLTIKFGVFSFISGSIRNIGLDVPIDFSYLYGYKYEASNSITISSAYPSPGYTQTGWITEIQKIDQYSEGQQRASDEFYKTILHFVPTLEIGLKAGFELPGSTSSWFSGGLRVELRFWFEGDFVSCDFPYLYGSVEPAISLFIAYSGFELLSFGVIPSFDVAIPLWSQTYNIGECAFSGVVLDPKYSQQNNQEAIRDNITFITIKEVQFPDDRKVSITTDHFTSFYPYQAYPKSNNYNFRKPLSKITYVEFDDGVEQVKFDLEDTKIEEYPYTFTSKNDQHSVICECIEVPYVEYGLLLKSISDQYSILPGYDFRMGLIYGNNENGYSIANENDIEIIFEGDPEKGMESFQFPYLQFRDTDSFLTVQTQHTGFSKDYRIDVYSELNSTEEFVGSLYLSKKPTYYISNKFYINNIYKMRHKFVLFVEDVQKASNYYDYYIPSDYEKPKSFSMSYTDPISQEELNIDFSFTIDRYPPSVYIKNPEILNNTHKIGFLPTERLSYYNKLYPITDTFIFQHTFYFESNLKIDYQNIPEYPLAMAITMKDTFPLVKTAESYGNGTFLIKLKVNDNVIFYDNSLTVNVPMKTSIVNADYYGIPTELHSIFLIGGEFATTCSDDLYMSKSYFGGNMNMEQIPYGCVSQKSEADTWILEFYDQNDEKIDAIYNTETDVVFPSKNETLVLFHEFSPTLIENDHVLVKKRFYHFPLTSYRMTAPNQHSYFADGERCLYIAVKDLTTGEFFDQSSHYNSSNPGVFEYKPNNPSDDLVEFVCFCRSIADKTYCMDLYTPLGDGVENEDGYFILEAKTQDGIQIIGEVPEEYKPREHFKRQIIKYRRFDSFMYTKDWSGYPTSYTYNEKDVYKIKASVSVPKDALDMRAIQLYISGGYFGDNHAIGFDEINYTDDPESFIKQLGLSIDTKTTIDPKHMRFGNDSELILSIDIEPTFNKEWFQKAAALTIFPEKNIDIANLEFECSNGMKLDDDACVVDGKPMWVYYLIIAAICLGILLIIIAIIVIICKCCL